MKKIFATLIGIASIIGLSTQSGVADANVFIAPGSICNGPNPGGTLTAAYTQYGLENDAASTANPTVTCPIPLLESSSSTTLGRTRMEVYDRHSTQTLTCTLYQLNSDGTVNGSFTIGTASANTSGVQSLDSGLSSPTLTGAYFYIGCNLPGNDTGGHSHITSINILN